ncbi:MAG: phospholipase D family protein [archaeon]
MARTSGIAVLLSIVISAAVLSAGYFGFSFDASKPSFSVGCKTAPNNCGNANYAVYFCPQDDCDGALISEINSAKTSIHAAVYSLTLDGISDALIAAHNRGVDVKIVMDKEQASSQYSDFRKLKDAGVDVRVDGNSNYMHNKFAVIDGKTVTTGSYNWTDHATNGNDENELIISSETLAAQYEKDFQRIYAEAS